jgi:hypothetical protein
MPWLIHPWALAGLAGLPVAMGIYFLRGTARRRVVSNVAFWSDMGRVRVGGRTWRDLRAPWLLLALELAALSLLALGAAGPLRSAAAGRPLVVVLDDSWSMRARTADQTPRERAERFLRDQIASQDRQAVWIVRAGVEPVLLGRLEDPTDPTDALAQWRAESPHCDLPRAVALASSVGGPGAQLLVLTDHAPDQPPEGSALRIRAFGRPAGNRAIVHASRSLTGGQDRCMIKIANRSAAPALTIVTVSGGTLHDGSARATIDLPPRGDARLRIVPDAPHTPVEVRLPDDALALDNRATLLPVQTQPVSVRVDLPPGQAREDVQQAIGASGQAVTTGSPELLVTDDPNARADARRWVVRLLHGLPAPAYAGPFVVDRSHPLSESLSLEGVVWAARAATLPGRPLVAAGNTPLLTVHQRSGGQEFHLALSPSLSTLPASPAWPALWWDLLRLRASARPGLGSVNLRLGEPLSLRVDPSTREVIHVTPDGQRTTLRAAGGTLHILPRSEGTHRLLAGEDEYLASVNALDAEESDLTGSTDGDWGRWTDAADPRTHLQSVAWLPLLAAMAILILHGLLVRRSAGGDR